MADSLIPRRRQGHQRRNGEIPHEFPKLDVAQACDERLAAEYMNSKTYTLGIHRYGVQRVQSNANTPFGYQNPGAAAEAYTRHLQESWTEGKSPYTARNKDGNVWMGAPAVLTAKDDPKQPETVDTVLEELEWDWTEFINPQAILNDHDGCDECSGVERFPDSPGSGGEDEAHEPNASEYSEAENHEKHETRLPVKEKGPRAKPMHARVERLRKE
ncbi:uncharacterized protein PG998_007110 [Apiospora kogelbergensis]|uniref:uncharacterized protein n=1 Tax=Apiospora kogelbergensis TaxID=1337665 RepID=UPI003131D99E